MRLQTLTARFPTEKPPDPKNESPGTVGTVTGTEFQSVVGRTTLSYRKIVARFSPTTPIKSATPLRIVIEATASGRKWIARLDDRVLCVSAWPFVKSARLLLAESYPADTVVEIWRPNAAEWAMRGRLGAVAAMIIEGETTRAAPRTALRLAIPSGVTMRAAASLRSSSGRFWRGPTSEADAGEGPAMCGWRNARCLIS